MITAKTVSHLLTSLLSPSCCRWCKKSIDYHLIYCDECTKRILPIATIPLKINDHIHIPVLAASDYHDPLRSLVLAKGWSNRTASRTLGTVIWQHTNVRYLSFDVIVPIPLHWTRYANRGYNQAEEIALSLYQQSNKPLALLLKRNRKTAFQARIARDTRQKNVKGAFSLNDSITNSAESQYHNKTLLLVDDVMTTGATLTAAAQILLKLKPTAIIAVVGCRVVK